MGHQGVAHCALSVAARCRLTHFSDMPGAITARYRKLRRATCHGSGSFR
jgi:hypothetical protein